MQIQIRFDPVFRKQYKKLPIKLKQRFDDRLLLFKRDPFAALLRLHPLHGKLSGYWSINITGDVRAVYKYLGEEVAIFVLIGTHSQLYG